MTAEFYTTSEKCRQARIELAKLALKNNVNMKACETSNKALAYATEAEDFSDFIQETYGLRLWNVPTKSVLRLKGLYMLKVDYFNAIVEDIKTTQRTGKNPVGRRQITERHPNLSEASINDMIYKAKWGVMRDHIKTCSIPMTVENKTAIITARDAALKGSNPRNVSVIKEFFATYFGSTFPDWRSEVRTEADLRKY